MSGFGTYSMNALKDFNNKFIRETIPFDLRTIDNFEPNIYFTGSVMQRLSSTFRLGLNYQFHSTGSRLGQKDYSGVYTFDFIIKGHSLAFEPEILLSETSKIKIYTDWLFGASYSFIESKENMKLTDFEEKYDDDFVSISPFIQASVKLKISILKNIEWVSILGGCIDLGGKVHLDGEKDAWLQINNDPVKSSWSGLRIQTGLEIAVF